MTPSVTQEQVPATAVRPNRAFGRLVFRWSCIAVLTGITFHRSLVILFDSTFGNTLNGYIWAVLAAALLASIGIAHRERRELPIHDRQTDIIVGLMVLVVALLLDGVLLGRYTLYFSLLRLDLVAMGSWSSAAPSCCSVCARCSALPRYGRCSCCCSRCPTTSWSFSSATAG